MAELAVNGAQSTLATAPSGTSGTSLAIQSGDTGKFPSSGNFACLLQDSLTSPTQFEIIEVTAVSGATFTITRASEPYAGSQTAQTWSAGAYITQVATAGTIRQVQIPSYDTTVLTKLSLAPVAYWKLNEAAGSTTAADSSGNGYTLTATGTVTFGEASVVPSDSETSAMGDGATGYLSASTFPALIPTGASVFTAIGCVKIPSGTLTTANAPVVSWGTAANGEWASLFVAEAAQLNSNPANAVEGAIYGYAAAASQLTLDTGTPHLCGMCWDGANLSAFLDGKPVISVTPSGTLAVAASDIAVLGSISPALFSGYATGRVAIFAGVLTPKDWALLMQAFTGV